MQEQIAGASAASIAGDACVDALEDSGAADRLPILRGDVPQDRREAEFAGDAEDSGAARAIGWAKKCGRDAGDVGEGALAAFEFRADAVGVLAGEIGVHVGVVAEGVAGFGDAAGELGMSADVVADEEKGCGDVCAGKQIEQGGGVAVAGAVVVGEGEGVVLGVGIGRIDEGGAEELGGRPAGGVGDAARDEAESGGCAGGDCHWFKGRHAWLVYVAVG